MSSGVFLIRVFNGLNILLIITAFINLKHLLNVKFYSWFVIQITTNDLRNLSAANLLRQCGIVDRRLNSACGFFASRTLKRLFL